MEEVETSKLVCISKETLDAVAQVICPERNKFYIENAEVVVGEDKYPLLRARLNIGSPGHYRPVQGLTHATDSLAAVGQLGYAFFAQAGLSHLMPDQIPHVGLDQIVETFSNANGKWAYLKRVEADYKHLPNRCNGKMRIESIHRAPEGYFFDTIVNLAKVEDEESLEISGPSQHSYEARFSVNF